MNKSDRQTQWPVAGWDRQLDGFPSGSYFSKKGGKYEERFRSLAKVSLTNLGFEFDRGVKVRMGLASRIFSFPKRKSGKSRAPTYLDLELDPALRAYQEIGWWLALIVEILRRFKTPEDFPSLSFSLFVASKV